MWAGWQAGTIHARFQAEPPLVQKEGHHTQAGRHPRQAGSLTQADTIRQAPKAGRHSRTYVPWR